MEIIKKRNYYYLKHSYRRGKRVVTKEKYLGSDIPKNIEKIKDDFLRETKKELYEKLARIKNSFKKTWKKYPDSVKKELLVDFSVNFTYNTNAIEGSTVTKEETEDIIKRKISPNKSIRDIQETIRHSRVFLEMLNEKKDLTLSLLLKWHKEIFQESKSDIAGRLRDYNVRVGDYRCPDWQDVKNLIRDFFIWYNKNKAKEHPVELAAMAHYKFVKIHPFGDGNGRIARLIANFVLNKHRFPLIVVEYKDRKSYYRALRKADKEEYEFTKYFVRRYLSMYKDYLKKL
ncbi:Fic family protein [Candidatus Woesearchaeota archaeon]|nr:Fic family protein [Candidatus Woesearchaeota archaeon]